MGRFAGLSTALNVVADQLRTQRQNQEKVSAEKNLLGFKSLLGGEIVPSDTGSISVPGMGKFDAVGRTSFPTALDLRKEARSTVTSMISQNPDLQTKIFDNPKLMTDLIDKETVRLSNILGNKGVLNINVPEVSPVTHKETTAPVLSERVYVKRPGSSKIWSIPREQLQDAIDEGAKLVPSP